MASAVVRALFATALCSAAIIAAATTTKSSTLSLSSATVPSSTTWASTAPAPITTEARAIIVSTTTERSTTSLSNATAETNVPTWVSTNLLGWTADPMGTADPEICAALILCVIHRDAIAEEACADVDTVRQTVFFVHASKMLDVCIDSCDVVVAFVICVCLACAWTGCKMSPGFGHTYQRGLFCSSAWGITLGLIATIWVPVAIKISLNSGLEALERLVDAECFPAGFGHNALVYQYDTASGMNPVLIAQICLGVLGVLIQVMQLQDIDANDVYDDDNNASMRRAAQMALMYVFVAASELAVDSTDFHFNYKPLYDNLNEIYKTLFQQQGVFEDGTTSIVHYVGADLMPVQWELQASDMSSSPSWWVGLVIPAIIVSCMSCCCCLLNCGLQVTLELSA